MTCASPTDLSTFDCPSIGANIRRPMRRYGCLHHRRRGTARLQLCRHLPGQRRGRCLRCPRCLPRWARSPAPSCDDGDPNTSGEVIHCRTASCGVPDCPVLRGQYMATPATIWTCAPSMTRYSPTAAVPAPSRTVTETVSVMPRGCLPRWAQSRARPCDDMDVCTTGDEVQPDCSCAGTFQDSDGDGVCDANDLCPGGPEPGTACDDGNPGTSGETIQPDCSCGGGVVGAVTACAQVRCQQRRCGGTPQMGASA